MPTAKKLTPKQEQFYQEYSKDFNATQAYKKVYKCGIKTAEVNGHKLLSNTKIQALLAAWRKKQAIAAGVTQQMIIDEYKKIGFANIQDYLDAGNSIKDISKLPRDLTAAVESIQSDIRHDGGDSEGYTEKVKVKFYSKLKALEDLGRHLGLFEKDNSQKKDNLADFLKAMASGK